MEDPLFGFRKDVEWIWYPSVDKSGNPAPAGWFYGRDGKKEEGKGRFFYEGLNEFVEEVTSGLDHDERIKVYVYEDEIKGTPLEFSSGIFSSDGRIVNSNRFLDKVTTEYNKHLKPAVEEVEQNE